MMIPALLLVQVLSQNIVLLNAIAVHLSLKLHAFFPRQFAPLFSLLLLRLPFFGAHIARLVESRRGHGGIGIRIDTRGIDARSGRRGWDFAGLQYHLFKQGRVRCRRSDASIIRIVAFAGRSLHKAPEFPRGTTMTMKTRPSGGRSIQRSKTCTGNAKSNQSVRSQKRCSGHGKGPVAVPSKHEGRHCRCCHGTTCSSSSSHIARVLGSVTRRYTDALRSVRGLLRWTVHCRSNFEFWCSAGLKEMGHELLARLDSASMRE
jgi:hypothetical protein